MSVVSRLLGARLPYTTVGVGAARIMASTKATLTALAVAPEMRPAVRGALPVLTDPSVREDMVMVAGAMYPAVLAALAALGLLGFGANLRAAEEEDEGEGDEDVEGDLPGDQIVLPPGWEVIRPEGKAPHLLSPGMDNEGKVIKRVVVARPAKMRQLQAPSKVFPTGRFHELTQEHFFWIKRKRSTAISTKNKAPRLQTVEPVETNAAEAEPQDTEPLPYHFDKDEMELKMTEAKVFRERRVALAGILGQRRSQMANDPLHKRIMAEIGLSKTDAEHPLNYDPAIKMNRDIYADLLHYCRERMPYLLDLVLGSLTDPSRAIQPEDIGRLGFLVNQIIVNTACKQQFCTGLMKIMTTNCRDSGTNRGGIDILQNVRVTQGHSAATEMRTHHASKALEMYKQYGKKARISLTFDNVCMQVAGELRHYTQGYTMFELPSHIEVMKVQRDHNNQKTLDERLELFSLDTINVEHESNDKLKKKLDTLAVTVVGRIIGSNLEGYEHLLRELPAQYEHANKDTSGEISHIIKNPPIPLNEALNTNMCDILEEQQMIYLNTVAMKSSDPEVMQADISMIRNCDASKEQRMEAEERIWAEVTKHGELYMHADLATVEGIEKAKNLRRSATNDFERLLFIKICRSGNFHVVMNKTIQDFSSRMLVERSVEDVLSLANIRTEAGIKMSNDEAEIKKHFEFHSQALRAIGTQAIISAFKEFATNPGNLDKPASEMIMQFISQFKFKYYIRMPKKPDTSMEPPPPPFYDDLESNVVDLGSRMLVSEMLRLAEKNADGEGLRACKLSVIPYFLNKSHNQLSKYALYLLKEHVDFIGLSDREQDWLDRWSTVNTSGIPGHNVSMDATNEHINKEFQKIGRRSNSNMESQSLERDVMASNISDMMIKLDREVNLKDGGEGGGRSSKKLTDESIEDLIEMFESAKPFSKARPKIIYKQKMKCFWEGSGLNYDNVNRFIVRNKLKYKVTRLPRKY